ncbi:ScbA/BarX family gamma-butyrolactone biosynthesis protein [Streptomyces sp. NPDC002328]|uniref:ScbA/BarX family gamma-butyrolactone biosynthesis protein n=1 Tax=Streptomyces sp. NPDC002328 TaxID=3364642 RepID=UPI0036AC7BC0
MSASTFRAERPAPGTPHRENGHEAPAFVTAPRGPSLTTTVPREFVHRASVAEVMLTGWERLEESRFAVAAQWPRRHGFFAAVEGCHDPLLVAETIRQAGILLAHTEFGVPLGHQFLMFDLTVGVRPEQLRVAATPAALDITVVCTDVRRRGGRLAGLHYEAVIRRDGEVAATGGATFSCTAPAVYRRLRARAGDGLVPLAPAIPVAPGEVGRVCASDVVLSPAAGGPGRWQLRVDTRHPVLFDHPCDHVPGMVLLEAARQAAAAFLGRPCLPVAVTGEFARYAELDAPCTIEACSLPPHPDGAPRLLVTARQNDTLVFTSTLTLTPAPAPAQAPAPAPASASAPAQAPAPA